jgi:cytochrome c
MSTYELNKIIGAILFAGLVAMVSFVVPLELFHLKEEGKHEAGGGHAEASAEATPAEGAAEAAGAAEEVAVPLGTALAQANAENGAKVFKKCASCHTIEKDGKAKVGPNLWGIIGASRAHMAGFAYSDAMKGKGGNWDFATLNEFVSNPKGYVPGTKMAFAGIKKSAERADLLLFLNTQSDAPEALPAPE